jgi:hypothetical protein
MREEVNHRLTLLSNPYRRAMLATPVSALSASLRVGGQAVAA